jgi:hypothetical protein
LYLGGCGTNYLFFLLSSFSKKKKKKTILNVKNLENSIKAGGQMRTHGQSKQSSKAFDQSNQKHSVIPKKTIRLLLNLFLYAENFQN